MDLEKQIDEVWARMRVLEHRIASLEGREDGEELPAPEPSRPQPAPAASIDGFAWREWVPLLGRIQDPERFRFHYQGDLWGGGDMLGLGVASFGYFGGVHYQNEVTLGDYVAAVEQGTLPPKRAYALNDRERLVREFLLQLKLGRVEAEPFREKFGVAIQDAFGDTLPDLERRGLLRIEDSAVVLSREGLLRVDRLLPELYDSSWRNLRYT